MKTIKLLSHIQKSNSPILSMGKFLPTYRNKANEPPSPMHGDFNLSSPI